jgi:CheY-like chemotaxis protein
MTSTVLVAHGPILEFRPTSPQLADSALSQHRPRESAITQLAPRILRPVMQRKALADVSLRLQQPLESLLRLTSSLEPREIDALAARTIDQHARALDVLTDFVDELLTMSESADLGEARPQPRLPRPGPAAAKSSASRIYRVLVVSEDRSLLTALRLSLLCTGCSVAATRSVDQALEQIRRESRAIDLIIADLELSGIDDGLALIDNARQYLGQIVPAVLLVDPESTNPGTRLAHDAYLLKKPISLKELTQLVSSLRERANKLLRG